MICHLFTGHGQGPPLTICCRILEPACNVNPSLAINKAMAGQKHPSKSPESIATPLEAQRRIHGLAYKDLGLFRVPDQPQHGQQERPAGYITWMANAPQEDLIGQCEESGHSCVPSAMGHHKSDYFPHMVPRVVVLWMDICSAGYKIPSPTPDASPSGIHARDGLSAR